MKIGKMFRKQLKRGNLVRVYYNGWQASISVIFAHERKEDNNGHLISWCEGEVNMRDFDFNEFKKCAEQIANDIGADIVYEVTLKARKVTSKWQ